MKKYRVTEKHKILKEGIILNYDIKGSLVHLFSITDITEWVEYRWIEEIQEQEFTKKDMEKAFIAGIDYGITDNLIYFTQWIKNYENKNKQ